MTCWPLYHMTSTRPYNCPDVVFTRFCRSEISLIRILTLWFDFWRNLLLCLVLFSAGTDFFLLQSCIHPLMVVCLFWYSYQTWYIPLSSRVLTMKAIFSFLQNKSNHKNIWKIFWSITKYPRISDSKKSFTLVRLTITRSTQRVIGRGCKSHQNKLLIRHIVTFAQEHLPENFWFQHGYVAHCCLHPV